jgi:hypothetical protein
VPKDFMGREDRRIASHERVREYNDAFARSANVYSGYTHRYVFGKFESGPHSGKTIEQVPRDYLEMLVRESVPSDSSICPRASDAAKEFLSKPAEPEIEDDQ